MSAPPLPQLHIALSARDCDGHFPQQPIIPGVVLLARTIAALTASGAVPPIHGIVHARLRQRVRPQDDIVVASRPAGERIRVELLRDGAVVADAILRTGAPLATWPAMAHVNCAAGQTTPDLDALLPHRPPMRWIQELIAHDDTRIACTAVIPAACALAVGAAVPPMAAIEAAAQGAALWTALHRSPAFDSSGGVPPMGYLVAVRAVEWSDEVLATDAVFTIGATLSATVDTLAQYDITAARNGVCFLKGSISTMLAQRADA